MPSKTPIKPVLFGCSGLELTSEEARFFAEAQPFGFILFKRNCDTPDQVRALIRALREAVGRPDAPLFIDQEGGPVARLKPPFWPALPAMRRIGVLFEQDPNAGRAAAAYHAAITAAMLTDLGFTGNFAPVLDLHIEGASVAIGDRALSSDPSVVADLGGILIRTYMERGIAPVIKHMPGHGRVVVDPHECLPRVKVSLETLKEDFIPFQANRHAPFAMNCHVVFEAIDPDLPVSLSAKAHQEILREMIGFNGLIFSDDLAMGALSDPRDAVALQALAAGADILLYCKPDLEVMGSVAQALPTLKADVMDCWTASMERLGTPPEISDMLTNLKAFDALLSE